MDSQTDSLPTTDSTVEDLKAEIAEKQSLLDSLKERMSANKLHPDDVKYLLSLLKRGDDDWDRSEPKPKNFWAKKKARRKMTEASQRRNRGL